MNRYKKLTSAIIIALPGIMWAGAATQNTQQCDATYGPMTVQDQTPQTVWSYSNACFNAPLGDYADNPVRPFLVGDISAPKVLWFASNSKGYFATAGVPVGANGVGDILAQMQRVEEDGECVPCYFRIGHSQR